MDKIFKMSAEDIKEIINWQGADGCLATDRITVDGNKVGYMYREESKNDYDSGWRFFDGTEDEEYLNNPKNIEFYKLNTICNYDSDIIPFLNSQYGSAFVRNEEGDFIREK